MANGGEWVENIQSAYTLLAYDRNAGEANVIAFDDNEKVRLNVANGSFGNAWDFIVPGNFLGYQEPPVEPPPAPPAGEPPPAPVQQFFPGDQVLVYSRSAGQAALVGFAATGKVGPNYTYSGWRNSWDMMVAGDFTGSGRPQAVLYDRTAGQADVVAFDTKGGVALDAQNSGWRTTWDLLVVGPFPGGPFLGDARSQVLLYDRSAGQADVVSFDNKGGTSSDTTNGNFGNSWNQIVAGVFLGTSVTWTWQAS